MFILVYYSVRPAGGKTCARIYAISPPNGLKTMPGGPKKKIAKRRQRGPPRPPKGAVMLTTLQSENLQITRPSAPVPVRPSGAPLRRRLPWPNPINTCRRGAGSAVGMGASTPSSRAAPGIAFQHNATGPRSGRLDATAARRKRRRHLELVRTAPYVACAKVQFENLL